MRRQDYLLYLLLITYLLLLFITYIYIMLTFINFIWLYLIIINRSGDIEKNPGLKPNFYQSFFICQWDLSSISAYKFLELTLL